METFSAMREVILSLFQVQLKLYALSSLLVFGH
jgi:hypothetical protein